jgi:transposase
MLEYFDLDISLAALSRNLKRHKWKKKAMKLVAQQRNPTLRAAYLFDISSIAPDNFVFVDESGVDRRTGARRTGWAPQGRRPSRASVMVRGKRFHILPALTLNGILDLLIYAGHTNSEGFLMWITQQLLPKMGTFPGPNSVLVMDNASWHLAPELATACEEAGVKLVYLPPYSPDFNPIEGYFGDLKSFFRRAFNAYEQVAVEDAWFIRFLRDCALEVGQRLEQIEGHFRHSGIVFPDSEQVIPQQNEGQNSNSSSSDIEGNEYSSSGEAEDL